MTLADYRPRAASPALPAGNARTSPTDHILFTLPHVLLNGRPIVTNEKIPVIIPFHGISIISISGSFTIKPGNGVTADLSIVRPGESSQRAWQYGDEWPLTISSMRESSPVAKDIPGLLIRPAIPWLEQAQTFHVFRISFNSNRDRRENKSSPSFIPDLLFGIQRPC